MAKTLAVIIPRYANNQETSDITDACIESLLEHAEPKRFNTTITIVDDGSKAPFTPTADVKFVDHQRNRGIAVAWNTGWQANPDADFYCWLNADCKATPNWSFPLVVAAERYSCVAMPYCNGAKAWGSGFAGFCFVTSRATAARIGPFDETFVPAWYEDIDWCQRAVNLGIPLLNAPQSNILHLRGKGGTQDVPRREFLHMANRYRFAWKHGTRPENPPPIFTTPLPEVEFDVVSS